MGTIHPPGTSNVQGPDIIHPRRQYRHRDTPLPGENVPLACLTLGQLMTVIKDAVVDWEREKHSAAQDGAKGLSADGAARLSCTRRSHILDALKHGGLPGTRQGSRWSVVVADLRQWTQAGKPIYSGRAMAS